MTTRLYRNLTRDNLEFNCDGVLGKVYMVIFNYSSMNIFKVIRYNRLREELQPIAHRTLSKQLKELEADNLVHREQYNEVPPRVEYSLTEEGKTLIPILELMAEWGKQRLDDQMED